MSTRRFRARLARLERGAAKAAAENSDPECDWIVDPALARAFRDDYERVDELFRKRYVLGGPITPAEEEEDLRLRANLKERARAVVCPPGYRAPQASRDGGRLSDLHRKRISSASCGGGLTAAEDAEEAQLTVRVAAYDERPEARDLRRLNELELRAELDHLERKRRKEPSLDTAERQELDDLRKRYPKLPPDPSDRIAQFNREAIERIQRALQHLSDDERDAIDAMWVAFILKHRHGYQRE